MVSRVRGHGEEPNHRADDRATAYAWAETGDREPSGGSRPPVSTKCRSAGCDQHAKGFCTAHSLLAMFGVDGEYLIDDGDPPDAGSYDWGSI